MKFAVAGCLLLVMFSGALVALTRRPARQVLMISAHGLLLSMLFLVLEAPDVAYSEIAVGTALVPVMFLTVLATIRGGGKRNVPR
ncbi:MAG TPA: hydrogenase subunit MbhD domain-containing protein [Dyella sp.]|uniref:hydrogenase subunit MbhD domain-containing protein n=1 Tax=Dyella sp. TaxID=1869338 RepID=UPI002BA7C381|nr:hydrogenase subunit MbhD domain-containing protein [Dyella sp.]HUB92246.1 hydrogenase subunit MbhD domain-containing protein [Dyella sp.]